MAGLFMHAVVYAVVNGLLVIIWVLLFGGSWGEVSEVAQDPSVATSLGFWPIWPILFWGAALLIHAGAVISYGLFGRRARRRRRKMARKAADGIKRHKEHRAAPAPVPASGRRWVVVMFTDIARSTPLTEALGDEAWAEVLSDHRTLVRECIEDHDGTEVGTQGDGFLVRFDLPDHAVDCAVHLQQRLDDARRSGTFTPTLRVGIHAGEAVHNEEDVVGRAVNIAARVVDAAEPDEILITEPVSDHLDLPVDLDDRGLVSLKGVSQPRHVLAVRWAADESVPSFDDGTGTGADR